MLDLNDGDVANAIATLTGHERDDAEKWVGEAIPDVLHRDFRSPNVDAQGDAQQVVKAGLRMGSRPLGTSLRVLPLVGTSPQCTLPKQRKASCLPSFVDSRREVHKVERIL